MTRRRRRRRRHRDPRADTDRIPARAKRARSSTVDALRQESHSLRTEISRRLLRVAYYLLPFFTYFRYVFAGKSCGALLSEFTTVDLLL